MLSLSQFCGYQKHAVIDGRKTFSIQAVEAADYWVVDDLFKGIPALKEKILKLRK